MFQLTIQSIVQFAGLIIYTTLICLVMYSKQVRLKRLFLLFLIAAVCMSLASMLLNLRLPYEQLLFWKMLLPLFTTWLIVAYAHFVTAFINRNTERIVKLGYIWVGFTFALVAFGYFTQGLSFLDNG